MRSVVIVVVAAVVGALAVVGCGGGGSSSSPAHASTGGASAKASKPESSAATGNASISESSNFPTGGAGEVEPEYCEQFASIMAELSPGSRYQGESSYYEPGGATEGEASSGSARLAELTEGRYSCMFSSSATSAGDYVDVAGLTAPISEAEWVAGTEAVGAGVEQLRGIGDWALAVSLEEGGVGGPHVTIGTGKLFIELDCQQPAPISEVTKAAKRIVATIPSQG